MSISTPQDIPPLGTFDLYTLGKHCRIRVFPADLTKTSESYDILACSAFRGNYAPTHRTVIGALKENCSISVHHLAQEPEIDMKAMGCWLSAEIPGPFRRIACLELLELSVSVSQIRSQVSTVTKLLKSTFLTLRHLLENADENGIPIRSIAMPVLGAGNQGIDTEYIAAPLFSQCMNMFRTIESLDTIDFYELNPSRAEKLTGIIQSLLPRADKEAPSVFISYSTRQITRAHSLCNTLKGNGFSVWIAPEGIPAGSNYLREIPSAISNAGSLVLMLTQDAMLSPWVQREASSAVGAGKQMIPVQLAPFDLTEEFSFLLDGIQILPVWSFDEQTQDAIILSRLRQGQKV